MGHQTTGTFVLEQSTFTAPTIEEPTVTDRGTAKSNVATDTPLHTTTSTERVTGQTTEVWIFG